MSSFTSAHLVTFADSTMSRAVELCCKSAEENRVYFTWPWTTEMLQDTAFYADNRALLSQPRGCGYWAWKPYIILDTMNRRCSTDQWLIYADAGVEFIASIDHIRERMDQDVWLFGNNWEHAHWCKRDVVEAVWPFGFLDALPKGHSYIQEKTWERFGKQVQASVIFFRVSDYSRAFVAEWLKWCLHDGGRLIDDSPSRTPNHPEFREHRHDQSILTTLAYREGLALHWWPAIYNRFTGGPIFTYEKGEHVDTYPPLFHHHRLRDSEWPAHPIPSAP